MPDKYQLVRLVPLNAGVTFTGESASKETLLSRIFGLNKQAEAKTINP